MMEGTRERRKEGERRRKEGESGHNLTRGNKQLRYTEGEVTYVQNLSA